MGVLGRILPSRNITLPREESLINNLTSLTLATALLLVVVVAVVLIAVRMDPEVAERLRNEYTEHLRALGADNLQADEPAIRHEQQYTAIRLALLARERATVIGLHDEHRIDDTVLLDIQTAFAAGEVRLGHERSSAPVNSALMSTG
ncbi:hypothetical protein [Nocardia sp. NPDC005366]|uniref:hypothetical protein n=1 Tax=Nocardia sp. NPDC005366 TaxID=3156878 RepID=UPI0033BE8FB9